MRLHKAGDINRQSSRETPVRHGREKRKIKPKGEKEKKLSLDGQGPKKGRATHPIKQAKTYRNRSLNRPKCLRTKTTIGKPLSQRGSGPHSEVVLYRGNPWLGRGKPPFHSPIPKISLIYELLNEQRIRY